MNFKTTSGQNETDHEMTRQVDTVSHAVYALSGPVVALSGKFHLRSRISQNIDTIVSDFIEQLEQDKRTSKALLEPETKFTVARTLSSTLSKNLREQNYPFNLFNFVRPSRFAFTTAQTHSLLAWGVGFSRFEVAKERKSATRKTLKDFENLRSNADCVAFAQKWGPLGPTVENLFFISEQVEKIAWFEDLSNSGLLPSNWSQEEYRFLGIPLTGEPLDAWLWHSGRLRSWRILLQPLNSKRAIESVIHELERFTDIISFPNNVDSSKPCFVRPSAIEGFKSILQDENLELNVEPWTYVLHQEGGESYFGLQEFTELKKALSESDFSKRAKKLEVEIKVLVAKLLRLTLSGNISLVPKIGMEDREVIKTDSLLSWLYLEFSREFSVPLGAVKSYVDCIVCGTAVSESPHARDKRMYCGGSCQKLKQRHGLDEARRRVKLR